MTIKTYSVGGVSVSVSLDAGEFQQNITQQNRSLVFGYPCGSSQVCSHYSLVLQPGTYRFETWGAQGGKGAYGTNSEGGCGGYSSGFLKLSNPTKTFVFVGNSGTTGGAGGFNGGGSIVYSVKYEGGGGGGSSDIRLFGTTLNHRIIVGGGGGGTEYSGSPAAGHGGGLEGIRGKGDKPEKGGYGGTQTQGGLSGSSTISGKFGNGGNVSENHQGAGGGGWYGGGCGTTDGDGGGGSGFVFSSTSASNTPNDYQISHSLFLTKGETISGNALFSSPYSESGKETGHRGRGAVRITFLEVHIIRKTRSIHHHNLNLILSTLISAFTNSIY